MWPNEGFLLIIRSVLVCEPLANLCSASCRDVAADGCDSACRNSGVPPATGVRPARSRLSDHPGAHLLPWGEPGRHGFFGDSTDGAAVRTSAGPSADDLQKLVR